MPLFALIPSGTEWIIIAVIALLLFGAKKLPELARGLGRSMGEFKKAKAEFERELNTAITETDVDTSRPIARRPSLEDSKKS